MDRQSESGPDIKAFARLFISLSKNLLLLLLFFVFPLCPITGNAQQTAAVKPRFRFQHLNINLNNNRVESVIQDSYGYVWIGTLGGLHRYDGINMFFYLSSDDSLSVSGNRAGVLFEDSRGRLWIGSENGVCRYNREMDAFIRYRVEGDNFPATGRVANRIRAILEDDNGRIWCGSERMGLLYLDEAKGLIVPYFASEDHVLRNGVISLHAGEENMLWIGTQDNGLFRLDTKTGEFVQYRHNPDDPHSLAGNYIEDLMIDRKGNVWVATMEHGLDRLSLKDGNNKFIHYTHSVNDPNSLANNDVTTIHEDSHGNIWVCNENGGLHLYNERGDNFFHYVPDPSDPFSMSNISVKAIYEDRQGRLWIGSNLEGIDVIDKYFFRFDHYYQSGEFKSINNNIIRNFLEDEQGNLWIATDGGGLNYFDRSRNDFRFFRHDPLDKKSIQSNAVIALCADNDGRLWTGTWRGGVNIFDERNGTFSQLAPENYDIKKVFNLMKDSRGNIWIGTQSGGLSRYDWKEKKITTYKNDLSDPKSIADNDVLVVFEDSRKRIWIGTEFSGLNLAEYNEKGAVAFKRFAHVPNNPASLANDCVNHIFEDSKGDLWIATEGGLSKFRNEGIFKNYTIKDGLPSNHIKSIAEDDKGFLWLGTAAGLSRFHPVEETFRNYTHNDGLQHGEFSRYCVYKTRKGELIFGGTNGFNIFHPDSIKDNPYLPEVYITGLKIFNIPVKIGAKDSPLSKHISATSEITLSHKQSVFSFDFIALNYTHPHMNQYAFKMEGFEDEWNYVGNQRTATYTSLDPGEYVFRVIASNNDGIWNEAGRSIKVIITPPFWQTTLFKISLALVLFGMVYFVVQYRLRRLNRLNTELEEKVSERTFQLKKLVNDLQDKQKEVENANDELRKTHRQLELINSQLDRRVQERTFRLVKANQQLDRFVYSASHDLSAPLKSILGLINIAKMESQGDPLLIHLSHIEKSVLKLEMVIRHLTQFSRNMSAVTNSEFLFGDVVDEVLNDLRYYSSSENMNIIKNYCGNETMVSDFLRLKIVLTNLVTNAIKYRDKEKPENFIRISLIQDELCDRIEIEDNGIGIEREHQEKIFDMFFRGTTTSEGSGLGLFIVKDIIEKVEGQIEVQSEPGVLTTFRVILPHRPV